jgi:hypothetical protein
VLVGANGSGKTTILDAVAHVYQSLAGDEELGARRLGEDDVRRSGPAVEAPRQGQITIEALLSSEERSAVRQHIPKAPTHGPVGFVVGGELAPVLGEGRSLSLRDALAFEELPALVLPTSFREAARAAILSSSLPPCVLLPANRGALDDGEVFPFGEVATFAPRSGCLGKAHDRFAPLSARLALAFLGGERVDRGGTVARMWRVLAKLFPELPKPVDVRNLHLWFENGDGSVVPLSALSDGEREVVLLFGEVALRAPKDGVVLIDEVEQHLHPEWQLAVLEGLPSLVPTAQFIFATQSPYAASCAPDDVIKVGGWKHHGT